MERERKIPPLLTPEEFKAKYKDNLKIFLTTSQKGVWVCPKNGVQNPD